jgi:HlyD family secretion protein
MATTSHRTSAGLGARTAPGQTYDEAVNLRPVAPIILALALVGGLASCSGEPEPVIETGEVGTATVVEVVEAPANVVAAAAATITASATGSVRTIRVADGQRVSKGDVLLVIDSPETERALASARQQAAAAPTPIDLPGVGTTDTNTQAAAAAAQAFDQAREAARQIPDRQLRTQALQQVAAAEAQYRAVLAQADATASQVNQGITGLEQALAGLTRLQQVQAQTALASAERAVDELTVRAPISGRVVVGASAAASSGTGDLSGLVDQLPDSVAGQAESLLGGGGSSTSGGSTTGALEVGSPVSSGDPLLTITDVSTLSLRAEVDETDVLLVHKGVRADVELDAVPGASYQGVVRNVDLSPTTTSRGGVTYVVRLDLGGGTMPDGLPAPKPRPGMSAITSLRVAVEKDTVAVPVSAVYRDGDADAVWIVENGVAESRPVSIGAQGEDFLQVTDGLQVGDLIVTRGADQVQDGQQIP